MASAVATPLEAKLSTTEGPEDISFDGMVARQQQLAEIAANDPNLSGYMSSIGAGGSRSTVNNGSLFLLLKPGSERQLDPDGIIQELRTKFAEVPGIRTYIQNPPAIQVGGRQSKAQYQYTLQSTDLDALCAQSGKVVQAFQQLPGFQDVTTDLDLNSPSIAVQVDRGRLAPLGLTMAQVQSALGAAFGQTDFHHLRHGDAVLGDSAGRARAAETIPMCSRGCT